MDFLTRTWEHLLGRLSGPFWIRILLQPLVSAIIGLLIGIKDARAGRQPFVWRLVRDRLHRHELLREAWRDVARIFIIAVIIDGIYQIVVLHWIHPMGMLLVAITLVVLPYALVRFFTNQIVSFWLYRQTRSRASAVSRKSA